MTVVQEMLHRVSDPLAMIREDAINFRFLNFAIKADAGFVGRQQFLIMHAVQM